MRRIPAVRAVSVRSIAVGSMAARTAVGVVAFLAVAAMVPPVLAATAPLSPTSSAAVRTSAVLTGASPWVSSAAESHHLGVAQAGPRALPAAKSTGRKGQTLTVTPSRGLSSYGETVRVSGAGFSELVGIYVGLCVVPRLGAKPTPCGGGIDQDGSSQASAWISSNPPPYGRNLAIPYKRGGTFAVSIKVNPMIGAYDCRKVRCAVVARADHTRSEDRSWDVFVPVTFR